MSEMMLKLPVDLQAALEQYHTSPDPRPEFTARLEAQLRKEVQRSSVGESVHERMPFMKLLRTRPLVAALLALLILLALSGVAYALRRSLGYIPGVGVVDQSTSLRVLSQPVTVTRDGITFTVTDAVLSADKTTLLYSIENVPQDAVSHNESVFGCMPKAELRLPDGRSWTNSSVPGYQGRLIFDPVPADVSDATLYMDCIMYTLPGLAPENWELPLRFIPAPPDRLTSIPVIEYTPEATATSAPQADGNSQGPNPISISKVIDAGDGYILIGEFTSPTPQSSSEHRMSITDANGDDVPWDIPEDIDPGFINGGDSWAVKFNKGVAFPIHVSYSELVFTLETSNIQTDEFEFDAGTDSQIGTKWDLNRQVTLAGYTFTLASVEIQQGGGCAECLSMFEYTFLFHSPQQVKPVGPLDILPEFRDLLPFSALPSLNLRLPDGRLHTVAVEFVGNKSNGVHMGVPTPTEWEIGVTLPNLLRGKVTARIADLPGTSEYKTWTLDWRPADAPAATGAAPSACFTKEVLAAALANPAPLPDGLTGVVLSSSMVLSRLDGAPLRVIDSATSGDISPDGSKVVYNKSNQGIFVLDVTSGETYPLPGTTQNDVNPMWSRDGVWIFFVRAGDNLLFRVHADGTGLQQFPAQGIYYLMDLSADGSELFYMPMQGAPQKLNVLTNLQQDWFSGFANVNELTLHRVAHSPDGTQIAYARFFSGSGQEILYLAHPDGTESRAVSAPGEWGFTALRWSPDGQWLMVGLAGGIDAEHPNGLTMLLNPQTCAIVPLPIKGDVQSWAP